MSNTMVKVETWEFLLDFRLATQIFIVYLAYRSIGYWSTCERRVTSGSLNDFEAQDIPFLVKTDHAFTEI